MKAHSRALLLVRAGLLRKSIVNVKKSKKVPRVDASVEVFFLVLAARLGKPSAIAKKREKTGGPDVKARAQALLLALAGVPGKPIVIEKQKGRRGRIVEAPAQALLLDLADVVGKSIAI